MADVATSGLPALAEAAAGGDLLDLTNVSSGASEKMTLTQLKVFTDVGLAADAHVHAAADVTSGQFADARISSSSVLQYNSSIDHGALLGTGDDDHTQYHTDVRGDARYYTQTQIDAGFSPIGHTHAAADVTSGTFADARISQSSVTQYNAALDHGTLAGVGDDDHPQYYNSVRGDAQYYPRTEADTIFMKIATPILGGPLDTQGNDIIIRDEATGLTEVGRIGESATANMVFLAHTTDGAFNTEDGAVGAGDAVLLLYGSTIGVNSMAHANPAGRQVYVAENGVLYAVDPPPASWSDSDTDAGNYDLGTGTGDGAWVELTGLDVTVQQQVEAGEVLNISVRLTTVNKTDNRQGQLDVAFDVPGQDQAVSLGASASVGPGFNGVIPISFNSVAGAQIPATTVYTIYARISGGNNAQFGIDLNGATTNHTALLSFTGTGGGAGDGDVSQGTGGADAQVATWQSWSGKTLGGGPIAADIVTGPASATDGNMALFDGATGKVLKDLGISASDFAPVAHVGAGGAEHANAIAAGASGFMTGADKTKLDGVTAGAEPNDPATALQGAGGADNEFALWQSWGSRTLTGVPENEYLKVDRSATIFPNNGFAAVARVVASGNITPNPLSGNFIRYQQVGGSCTVEAMPNEGSVTIGFEDDTVTVNFDASYRVVGSPPSGDGEMLLQLTNSGGGVVTAIWA